MRKKTHDSLTEIIALQIWIMFNMLAQHQCSNCNSNVYNKFICQLIPPFHNDHVNPLTRNFAF